MGDKEEYILNIRKDDLKESPLVSGRQLRARQLGLTPKHSNHMSFEANQSFPKIQITKSSSSAKVSKALFTNNNKAKRASTARDAVSADRRHVSSENRALSDFNGNTYSDVSYTSIAQPKKIKNDHLIEYMSNRSICGNLLESVDRNHWKALLTVDRKTTEILMANRIACELLYFTSHELIGQRLDSLVNMMPNGETPQPYKENLVEDDGEIMEIAGLIMEITSNGVGLSVSVFVKSLPDEEGEVAKSIVIMESVNIMVAEVIFDSSGLIHQAEDQNVDLPLLGNCEALYGMHIQDLIANFKIPDTLLNREQMKQEYNITLHTEERSNLPAVLRLLRSEPHSVSFDSKNNTEEGDLIYLARITSFININGLITFTEDGLIHSINDGFARNLTGYTSQELIGSPINNLVPSMVSYNHEAQPKEEDKCNDNEDDGICLEKNVTTSHQAKSPFSENGSVESGVGKSTLTEASPPPYHHQVSAVHVKIDAPESPAATTVDVNSTRDAGIGGVSKSYATSLAMPLNDGTTKHYNSPATVNAQEEGQPRGSIDLVEVMDRLNLGAKFSEGLSPTNRNASSVDSFASTPLKVSRDVSVASSPGIPHTSHLSHVSSTPNHGAQLGLPSRPLPSTTSTPMGNRYQKSTLLDFGTPLKPDADYECGYKDGYLEFNPEDNVTELYLRHKNGTEIELGYLRLHKIQIKDQSKQLNCLWIGINNPIISSLNNNNAEGDFSIIEQASRTGNDLELSVFKDKEVKLTVAEDDSIMTPPKHCPYASEFYNLQSIGKGAFGFVRLAKRHSDQLEVVVKFIKKKYVIDENWVNCEETGKLIPMEAYILGQLDHTNIIKIIDSYESEKLHILIMEKHGSGFDMFELIDRKPVLDEPIQSYMFRQVVNAIKYLHDKGILHRDIKDENIIVNHQFQVKLIDFGSAVYMPKDGELFSTFCGTYEYCSPEVLKGHRYKGPELEMWTLGVMLYTLVFLENPFLDIEDTLRCQINPPSTVSRELERVIFSLMEYSEYDRMTLSELLASPWLQQEVDVDNYNWNAIVPDNDIKDNISFANDF